MPAYIQESMQTIAGEKNPDWRTSVILFEGIDARSVLFRRDGVDFADK